VCIGWSILSLSLSLLQVNDYPQKARHKILMNQTKMDLQEEFEVAIIQRGSYVVPGRSAGPTEEKLHLLVEGTNQGQVRPVSECCSRISFLSPRRSFALLPSTGHCMPPRDPSAVGGSDVADRQTDERPAFWQIQRAVIAVPLSSCKTRCHLDLHSHPRSGSCLGPPSRAPRSEPPAAPSCPMRRLGCSPGQRKCGLRSGVWGSTSRMSAQRRRPVVWGARWAHSGGGREREAKGEGPPLKTKD
jgi:hypothetical protein